MQDGVKNADLLQSSLRKKKNKIGIGMNKDSDKIQLYVSKEWLKAFLKLIVVVIVPYNIIMFLLWNYTRFLSPQAGTSLGMWGTFAIAFVWCIIVKRRNAKEK